MHCIAHIVLLFNDAIAKRIFMIFAFAGAWLFLPFLRGINFVLSSESIISVIPNMHYNLTDMFVRKLTSLAFVSHVFIGAFCMIPVANVMAAEGHAEIQGMSMMSHEDCDHCSHEEHGSEKGSSCGSGHCLSAHKAEASLFPSVIIEMRAPALLSAAAASVTQSTLDQHLWLLLAERPPSETGTSTIVLRE